MITETDKDILVAIYGMQQVALRTEKLLDDNAKPIKSKNHTAIDNDGLSIYAYLAEKLKRVSEYSINKRKEHFNIIARRLSDEYNLNMYAMSLFLMMHWIETQPVLTHGIMKPKLNRLIKHMRESIMKHNDDGFSIMRDSAIGASNIFRMFTGQAELTKEVREKNVNKWKNVAKNKPK